MSLLWILLFALPATTLCALLRDAEIQCVNNSYPPDEGKRLPTYVINLDLPPEERWQQLGKDKRESLLRLIDTLKNFTVSIIGNNIAYLEMIDFSMSLLLETLPDPYQSEIRGLAKSAGLPVGMLTWYNVFYEISPMCTSILVRDDVKKNIIHGRNLDYGGLYGWDPKTQTWPMTEALRSLAVNLDFRKQNKTVFQTAGFVGYVGALTGVRNGQFSLSIDMRSKGLGTIMGIVEWIFGRRELSWMGFTMRDVLESSTNFTDAQKKLVTTKLLAPGYYILAGTQPDQACVITKDRNSVTADVWKMADTQNWFQVETNYDHWEEPPASDNRRGAAKTCLNKKTQPVVSTFSGMFDVLSSKPVLSTQTIYTSLMVAAESKMESYLQRCAKGCA